MLRVVAILACAIVVSAFPNRGSATWKQIYQQSGLGKVSASWFFNDHIGIIGWDGTAWAGTLQRTTDGGITWTNCTFPKQTNTAPFITDIYFPPAAGGDGTPYGRYSDTGYCTVAGSLNIGDPRVWVTYDSGKTWTGLQSSAGFTWATSVRLTSHALVVAEGAGIGIHVSIDSGKSWSTSFSKFNGGLDFLDNSWGVATSVFSPILRSWGPLLYTSNGGTQWNTAGANFNHEEFGVYAMKHTSIFLSVGEDSVRADGTFPGSPVFRSMGSAGFGTNWALINTLPFQVNGGIAGINNVVYVQNRGRYGNYAAGLYRSRDSGMTWVNVGGPNEDYDVRFSVQTCGLVIYAFDDVGGVWKTTDGGDGAIIPECVCINKDTLRPLTSTICTQDSATYWIHNPNIAEVVIRDIRLLDSTRRPAKTGALQVDSLPANYEVILAGDSVAFKLGWNPHTMMDSTAGDSATIRIILYAGYLERVMVQPVDTFYLRVKLRGNGEAPVYTQNTKTIKLDAVTTCNVDSVINIKNIGCDSLRITKALLVKNNWTVTDSLGKPVRLPVTLKVGDSIRMFVHAITNGGATVQDSLAVTMHYQGKDSLVGIGLRVNANLPNPLTSPQAMAFDSVATCASIDKFFTISDTGCAATSLTIDKMDLLPLTVKDWTLLDSAGNPVTFVPPITIKAGEHRVFRLHFAPKNLGATGVSVVIHTQGTTFTNTIALTGFGAPSGTLSYAKAFDFGTVPFCGSPAKDTFLVFNNTSCDPALVDSVLLSGDFSLLDPLSLPVTVASGKSVSVHVLFHPTKKGPQTGTAKLIIFTNNGQTKIIDSVSITANGAAGASTFDPTPALAPVIFATRSTCGNLDSVVYSVKNNGCDTLLVTGVNFDAAIAGDYDGHSDQPFPIRVPGGQSIRVVVAMAQLAPGLHAGNYHLLYTLADGSVRDRLFPIWDSVSQGSGTSTIQSTSQPTLDFGPVHSCQSRDTDIVYTADGCGSLVVNRSISGAGFTMSSTGDTTLQPKGREVLHVHYSNATPGPSLGVVTIKTGPPQNQTLTYNVMGMGLPVDTVHFLISFSKMPVGQGESFHVLLKPDKAVSASAGIHSIAGVLTYHADAFMPGAITGLPGVTTSIPAPIIVGKKTRQTFVFTSGSALTLDPSVPVMSAGLAAIVADSMGVTISVDSLVINGDDASFSTCTLSSTVLGLQSQFTATCGDSTLMWYLRGKPLITDQIRPNPVTSLDGYHGTIELNPALDGIAEINVSDAVGRVVSQSSVVLRGGVVTSYPFDLVKQSAGTYFYSIRFVSEHGSAMHNGTLMLLK